ncbi:MAG: ligase-associated DNA damage response exonuclease [Planctomycetota bacterium]
MKSLLETTRNGLYCREGDFYVDPWKPVDKAVITHAHADHARWGSKRYLTAETGRQVLQIRLGPKAKIDTLPFGESTKINGVDVSFFPAGHILGSGQVRLEKNGQVVVVSGDYKRGQDVTCRSFEPVRCHLFITESTFGLPIYRWPSSQSVFDQINQWWKQNQQDGKTSLLLAYALGKAQRLLAGVDPAIGPIFTHGAVEKLNVGYRETGIQLPETNHVGRADKSTDWSQSLVVAPPAAAGTTWVRKFGKLSVGMASGWMQIRGTRRRRGMDRGFILSDHVDWLELLQTIEDTEAEEVWVTHGYSQIVARYLNENGLQAKAIETEFTGETLVEADDSDLDPEESEDHPQPNEVEDE